MTTPSAFEKLGFQLQNQGCNVQAYAQRVILNNRRVDILITDVQGNVPSESDHLYVGAYAVDGFARGEELWSFQCHLSFLQFFASLPDGASLATFLKEISK